MLSTSEELVQSQHLVVMRIFRTKKPRTTNTPFVFQNTLFHSKLRGLAELVFVQKLVLMSCEVRIRALLRKASRKQTRHLIEVWQPGVLNGRSQYLP